MKITPVKTPGLVKKVFPDFIWNVSTAQKEIYLTFDDGPTPEITNWTLDMLSLFHAKATFFCIGNNVEKHPNLYKNIIDAGHIVGNHTHNHLKGWKTKTTDYLNNIEKASGIISSKLFRPPYGKIMPKQALKITALGYKVIMWDVLSFDWDNTISKDACLNNVINHTESGSIVVFHDSKKAADNMKYTLPKVLKYFSEKGYTFKSLEI